MSNQSLSLELPHITSHATVLIGYSENEQKAIINSVSVSPFDTVIRDASLDGGIKTVRDFASELLLSTQFGAIRLGIIYHAQSLTPEAQNALLKLLEEPPPRVKIVLFMDSVAALLPTVLSRCQRHQSKSVAESTTTPLFSSPDTLSQMHECESLAKEEVILERVAEAISQGYSDWTNKGRPDAGLDELIRLWYLYEQFNTQVNKRLILEQYVLSSLK